MTLSSCFSFGIKRNRAIDTLFDCHAAADVVAVFVDTVVATVAVAAAAGRDKYLHYSRLCFESNQLMQLATNESLFHKQTKRVFVTTTSKPNRTLS